MGFFDIFKRKKEYETKQVSRDDLRNKFKVLGFNTGWGYLDICADKLYKSPTPATLERLIKECPSDSYKYVTASRDCDDFARIFLGWLSQQAKGDYAIGWVRGWLVYEGKEEVYHKMCWAMSTEGLYFFEPQNDQYMWRHKEDAVKWPNVIDFKPHVLGI